MPGIYAESGGAEGGISVERLTYRDAKGEAWYSDKGTEADRLHFIADIEDIMGDECNLSLLIKLVTAYKEGRYIIMRYAEQKGVARLLELSEADRDGRCVVLPCKDGDKLRRDGIEFTADHWNLILTAFAEDKSTKSGKRVGLFGAKEAEAALKASDGE